MKAIFNREFIKNIFRFPIFIVLLSTARNFHNYILYKNIAPKFAQCIVIPLDEIIYRVEVGSQLYTSGQVVCDDIFLGREKIPIKDIPIIKKCRLHWEHGVAWEDLGVYDDVLQKIDRYGSYDECKNYDQVVERYQKLDDIFKEIKSTRELRLIFLRYFKYGATMDGILVHVGPNGELYFGGNGHHRLAIALALNLKFIPVQIGVVTRSGLKKFKCLKKV